MTPYTEWRKSWAFSMTCGLVMGRVVLCEAEKFAPAINARVVAVYGGVPKIDQVRVTAWCHLRVLSSSYWATCDLRH
eukprot:3858156-Amphidinium_carterae.3